jgi:hypothetical protein
MDQEKWYQFIPNWIQGAVYLSAEFISLRDVVKPWKDPLYAQREKRGGSGPNKKKIGTHESENEGEGVQ